MMKELKNKSESMSAREQNIYTILEIVEEMLARGISFKTVDIEKSDAGRFKCEEDGIRIPLIGVPGLGVKAAEKLVEERTKKPFISIEDIKNRGRVNKTVMEKLIAMGAVGDLPESSQRSFFL
jgi:DNA polymerase-3 subunit alpha (Gram-positive type)